MDDPDTAILTRVSKIEGFLESALYKDSLDDWKIARISANFLSELTEKRLWAMRSWRGPVDILAIISALVRNWLNAENSLRAKS
jgi:hypothetical protein